MAIRRATPGDLAAVLRIADGGFFGDDPFEAKWLIDKLAEPGTVLQVDDAGVGCVRGFLLTQKYAAGTVIRIIAVDPQFRRQGVGTGMLARVKGKAGAWVRVENAASRGMFERAGWVQSVPLWREAFKPADHSGDWVYFAKEPRPARTAMSKTAG